MALLKYLKPKDDSFLPDQQGPLNSVIPSSSIAAANENVVELLKYRKPKRGSYDLFTEEEKAKIARSASLIGVTGTIRKLSKGFHDRTLKDITVRMWMNKYKKELVFRKRSGKDVDIKRLENKRRDRPLLLGQEIDRQAQMYLFSLREQGAVINSAIGIGCASGIVKNVDCNLLSNGGHISFSKHWARYMLDRMGFVKRRVSTKAKISVATFECFKVQSLFDIQVITTMEDIPEDLIINWDQTGIHYVPVSNWTMAKEGSKSVEIAGADDKRQITVVFGGTMSGDFLPSQLIYQGKISKRLPKIEFPNNWHVTWSENHWSNQQTMEDYVLKLLLPYIDGKRSTIKLTSDHPALAIFDRFHGQCTDNTLGLLHTNNVCVVIVPPNCTERLQPLDVSVNKAAKECMRRQFHSCYSNQVCENLKKGNVNESIDLKMSVVKPLSAKWMLCLHDYMKSKPDIIRNGFHGSRIILK